jgi:LacI family transcriptional regulator
MKPITLKEIAVKLNISTTTASKALKGYSDVSETTRNAVLKLAKELNYTPNPIAVNLRTKQTKILGVIIPTVVHQFFSKVIDGIIAEAEKNGYLVITLQSNENLAFEKKQLELLYQKRVDGILISLSNETNNFEHINKIINNNIPVVLFDKISKVLHCSKVYINDKQAAYNAVTHLIKKGYKRIAHFRGSLVPQNSIDRFLGYKKALEDNGIKYDPSIVYLCDNNDDFNDGFKNAQLLLQKNQHVDAIFAITDLIAVGILKCFNENNVKIPKDIAVFGFSDWFIASVVSPTLSSVKQPSFEMGRKAAEILINEIKQVNKHINILHQNVVLPTALVIRKST